MLRDARHRRRAARANYAQLEENSEHLRIVQALAANDVDMAAEAMALHIDQAAEALVKDLFGRKEIEADSAESFLRPTQAVAAG